MTDRCCGGRIRSSSVATRRQQKSLARPRCHSLIVRRPPEPDADLLAFYTSVEDEAARLSLRRNRLEFIRTQALIRERLPAGPARVLDVGGGTGAHAAWLAADGHDVELIDPVTAHVRTAREAARALPRPFHATEGDARALDAPDSSVDVCLMLGPLYHLP